MSNWIPINSANFQKQGRVESTDEGVRIVVSLSPYDLPDAVRGVRDETSKHFLIEFRYLQDEPWVVQQHDSNLSLRVGKHSGRLIGIDLDTQALKANAVNLTMRVPKLVGDAIRNYSRLRSRSSRSDNYAIVEQVISDESERILEDLKVAAG